MRLNFKGTKARGPRHVEEQNRSMASGRAQRRKTCMRGEGTDGTQYEKE